MKKLSTVFGALLAVSATLNVHADPNIAASAATTPSDGFDCMTWDITTAGFFSRACMIFSSSGHIRAGSPVTSMTDRNRRT